MDMIRSSAAPWPQGTTPERLCRVPGRVHALDSIRALALFGVIVMNIGAMVMRFVGPEVLAAPSAVDLSLMALELAFVQGKARACFAFLFGFGFAILMIRAETKGEDFRRAHVRRMVVLFAFGLFNQAFFFWGDILCLYALLGLLLLAVRGWSDRAILAAGLLLIMLPPIAVGAVEAVTGASFPSLVAGDPAAGGLAALMVGDYGEAVRFNLPQTALRYATDTGHMIVYALGVLGLFLTGMWAARKGLAFDPRPHRRLLRRIAWIAIPVGLVSSLVQASRLAGFEAHGALYGLVTAAYAGLAILAFGYLAALRLLFEGRLARLQALLAPAGRMTLTNYLLSGAIGGWIFYGYGLGALRAFSFTGLSLLALALFAILALFSHLWLSRFRLGPAEWLWRSLAQGRRLPLRRPPQPQAAGA